MHKVLLVSSYFILGVGIFFAMRLAGLGPFWNSLVVAAIVAFETRFRWMKYLASRFRSGP